MARTYFGSAATRLLDDQLSSIPVSSNKDTMVNHILLLLPDLLRRIPTDGSWSFDAHNKDDPDLGFVLKRGTSRVDDTREDVKLYLHYTPAVPALLRGAGASGRDLEALMSLCQALYDLAMFEGMKLISDLDQTIPEFGLLSKFHSPQGPKVHGQDDHVLRILIYRQVHPDLSGQIGQKHFDRNGLTLALYESGPGLQYATTDQPEHWRDISSSPGHALAFGGLKMQEVTNGRLMPLRHRIIQAGTPFDDDILRVSVVMFMHPYNGYCRLRTH